MNNVIKSPWISYVKTCLDNLGLSEYFINQSVIDTGHFKLMVKSRLHDQFLQDWNSSVFNSSKCSVYRLYKVEHGFEEYLDILPSNLAHFLCKFRTLNHKLPIEKERYLNIDHNQRVCHLCNSHSLGDEFHYLFECTFFNNDRKKYIDSYYRTRPNTFKLEELMNIKDRLKLIKLAVFCKTILTTFR